MVGEAIELATLPDGSDWRASPALANKFPFSPTTAGETASVRCGSHSTGGKLETRPRSGHGDNRQQRS